MKKLFLYAVCAAALFPCAATLASCKKQEGNETYEITAEYIPDERLLSCQMAFTFTDDFESELSELKFELWANAYNEGGTAVSYPYSEGAYYNGESYGGIEITGVEGAKEYAVDDLGVLSVALEEPLKKGQSARLAFTFTITLAEVNHRMGAGEHNITFSHFYPVLCAYDNGFLEYSYSDVGDPFVNGCADYFLTLTVPKNYTAVFGPEASCTEQGGSYVYHVEREGARDLAFVLSQNLSYLSTAVDIGGREITVEYYYFSDKHRDLVLETAAESLLFYSETFGEYQRDCYVVVQTDFPYGGMEFDGMCFISCDLSESDAELAVAHETAHQWWYAAVGSNQYGAAWQDEGLAEYSTALYLGEKHAGYEDYVQTCETSYRAYFSVQSQLSEEADTAMTRDLSQFSGIYEYRCLIYDKSVIMYDRVREVLGEKKFLRALNDYYETYRGTIADEEDLIACFAEQNSSIEGLFRSFLNGSCVI